MYKAAVFNLLYTSAPLQTETLLENRPYLWF